METDALHPVDGRTGQIEELKFPTGLTSVCATRRLEVFSTEPDDIEECSRWKTVDEMVGPGGESSQYQLLQRVNNS